MILNIIHGIDDEYNISSINNTISIHIGGIAVKRGRGSAKNIILHFLNIGEIYRSIIVNITWNEIGFLNFNH